jgi:serine protease Do
MEQIVGHGKVVRGYLGLYPQDLDASLAKQFGLSQAGGALVGEISPDSPASRAGLKQGDVILELNGQPVKSANDLRLRVSESSPGTSVKLGVSRDGKMQDFNVTLVEFPADKTADAGPGDSGGSGGLEGVDVQNLTPDAVEQLQLKPGTHGVVVTAVDPASPAAGELDRGDVIQEVNHKPVANVQEYKQAVAASANKSVLLLVNQGGVSRFIAVEAH